MCTIVVAKNVFHDGCPLVVAANRDELLNRPSEGPQIRYDNGTRILCPRDSVRGGTWIGVNEYGVVVGLTNRLNVTSVPGRQSRGKIVADALQEHSAADVFYEISKLRGSDFNGFYLVVADLDNMYRIHGDGKELRAIKDPDGITNLGE